MKNNKDIELRSEEVQEVMDVQEQFEDSESSLS